MCIPFQNNNIFLSEYRILRIRIDQILNLFAGLKHLFASIQTKSNIYLQLENSDLNTEEDFIVNQYHDSWMEANNQFVIKSEVFLKDLLAIEHDFQCFGRCHASVKSINFSRVQVLLNSKCGVQNSISTISLINCNFLYVARMSSSLALTMKSIICQSLHPMLIGNAPDIGNIKLYDTILVFIESLSFLTVMNEILINLGLFTKEEGNNYLKHMINVQTIVRDDQIFVLFLIMMAIDDQPTLNSFRSYIGKLLIKKIYETRVKEDDSGYPKVIDNPLDLIEEKEAPKNSMETIDDLFYSVIELQRIVTPKLMKLNIEQEQSAPI